VPTPSLREAVQKSRTAIARRFAEGEHARVLVPELAHETDTILIESWRQHALGQAAALVAVGGYGRGELHPCSDIDLLVLTPENPSEVTLESIQAFVAGLWDLGLDIGHSVRSARQCADQARLDISTATALSESRLLAGSPAFFQDLRRLAGGRTCWTSHAYLEAKLREQDVRHHRYDDTAYKLEPNVKSSPGGLRDLQIVVWVAIHHFAVARLEQLLDLNFLTLQEYRSLIEARDFLWQVRFTLHIHAGRREDRLLFQHQHQLAEQFGFSDSDANLAVEQFMKQYYRTVMELSRLNEMLLELLTEAILTPSETGCPPVPPQPLNSHFQEVSGYLEISHPEVFNKTPWALMELFLVLQRNPGLKGVRATTIRQVRDHCRYIDDAFRADPKVRGLFMEILRQPRGITHVLERMHLYGVLDAYLPVFGEVAGRMQFDLFHVYTVDEHTLRVVGHLRGFAVPEKSAEFPLCSAIHATLKKPEILYIAGLFHDIAKGRGGDHSKLGAQDVQGFCRQHGFPEDDAQLAAWLVEHHLLMSVTSQRQDISDPEVIHRFATTMGTQERLDYLYLLTVADIRGTNPQLWNDWKATLLQDLYHVARAALAAGLDQPVPREQLVLETRTEAREIVAARAPALLPAINSLWQSLDDDYFLLNRAEEAVWHALEVARAGTESWPLVAIREGRGGTEILVYTRDQEFLFAAACSLLDSLGLSIVKSRITTTAAGMTLDVFVVLNRDGQPVSDPQLLAEISDTLNQGLLKPATARGRLGRRLTRRQLRVFSTPTHIKFYNDAQRQHTIVDVRCADQPALLAQIGWLLADQRVRLQNARIATFGERAEDIFLVTDTSNRPLDERRFPELSSALEAILDSDSVA